MRNFIKNMAVYAMMIAGLTAFTGCGNSGSKENPPAEQPSDTTSQKKEEHAHAHYQCPMDCEKGKTYEEPGKCPVCKMDLKEVDVH